MPRWLSVGTGTEVSFTGAWANEDSPTDTVSQPRFLLFLAGSSEEFCTAQRCHVARRVPPPVALSAQQNLFWSA